jgi:hypothetical protein
VNFYEIDELVLDTRYVRAIDGSIFPAAAPTNGASVVVRDAGTTTTRTVYDAPNAGANVIPQPLHTTNGRIEGYIAGETPIDLVVNGGTEPDGYVQRWSPPQAGSGGPGGGGLLDGQYSLGDYPAIDPEVDASGRLARLVQDIVDDGLINAGAQILVPLGAYSVSQIPAALMGAIDIEFRGVGGRGGGGATSAWIDYTGNDPNRAWDLRGSMGVRFVDVMLTYSNPAFVGTFLDYGHSVGTTPANRDSDFTSIDRCTIKGWGGADSASELISFDNAHSHNVGEVMLEEAVHAIVGRKNVNSYSNAITLTAVHTRNTQQAPIHNAGDGWVAICPVAEQLKDGSAGWYDSDFHAGGFDVAGGWMGDSDGTGWWVKWWGAGLQMRGTYLGGANGVSFGAGSSGSSVKGVKFDQCTKAFDVAAGCTDLELWPNTYNAVGTRITTADVPPNSILPTNSGGVSLSGTWNTTRLAADEYLQAYQGGANQVTLGRLASGVPGPGVALGQDLGVNVYKAAPDVLGTDDTLRIGANRTPHLDIVPVWAGVVAAAMRFGDGTGWRLDFGGPDGARKFSIYESGLLEFATGLQVISTVAGLLDIGGALRLAGALDLGGFKGTNAAAPTAAADLATKAYVDTVAAGLQQHSAVRAASVVNQPLGAQGSRTVDGVACASGDRVLLKAQTTASENGIYVVNADFSLSRAADGTQGNLKGGATVWANEGTTNADTAWTLVTNDPITVGTTAQTWTQSSALGQVVAGGGLTKTGSQLDVGAGTAIQVNADTIDVVLGSSGASAAAGNDPRFPAGADIALADLGQPLIDALLPWQIDVNPFLTPAQQTNWATLLNDANQVTAWSKKSSGAQDAVIGWDVVLAAGTWTIEILTITAGDEGIVTVALDGTSQGTLDLYSAAVTYNQSKKLTGLAVAATGKKRLTLTMATKNASSSNYVGHLTALRLLRTA